jgi:hypothetical protein
MTALPTVPWDPRWTCTEVETASPAATGIAALAATQVLHGLTGGQFGLTTTKLRPCRRDCLPVGYEYGGWPVGSWGYPYPALVGGTWVNLGCGGCGDTCSCTVLQEAVLPGVVHDVTEVRIDGTVVTGSAYRLDHTPSGDVLVRLDGGVWPTCQQLTRNDTQSGTWSVTARYGMDVPELGRVAVGELACEFLKAMGGKDCRLPEHVTSLARQGVTLSFPDPTELLTGGKLGLVQADRFISVFNPSGLRRRARTWSPDQRGLRQIGA